jgi:DUF1365 family protein
VLDVPPRSSEVAAKTDEADSGIRRRQCPKALHVSPFMRMDCRYDFLFKPPGRQLALRVESSRDGARLFDGTMALQRKEISGRSLAGTLLRHPFMTGKIIVAIYFEAMRLWFKGVPFVPHPNTTAAARPTI